MAATSKERLKKVLTNKLRLAEPEFHFEELPGGKLSGNIVSDTFKGMSHLDRQQRIWDALEAEFGKEASSTVGTLLAYTYAEWDVPLSGAQPDRRKTNTK